MSNKPTVVSTSFASRLIRWQKQHGRHDLPWQQRRDDYRVWLSEVMLQQTQVGTVIPYFERFLDAFPTLEALAAASGEQVMQQWSGLGYYSRARNLHRCAQIVVETFGGRFPDSREALVALPGIGRSTAAAIRVFAHGQRDAILDGNVKRVFCRHFGISGVPDSPPVLRELWSLAEQVLAKREVTAYTQGLMDLGATVCVRRKPNCEACPVSASCLAFQQGRVDELPTRRVRAALPRRETTVLILFTPKREVVLRQRPDQGIWGGLLSLPESALPPTASWPALLADCGLDDAFDTDDPGNRSTVNLPPLNHVFTHFRLTLHPVVIPVTARQLAAGEPGLGSPRLVGLDTVAEAALPRPVKTLLLSLAQVL